MQHITDWTADFTVRLFGYIENSIQADLFAKRITLTLTYLKRRNDNKSVIAHIKNTGIETP